MLELALALGHWYYMHQHYRGCISNTPHVSMSIDVRFGKFLSVGFAISSQLVL